MKIQKFLLLILLVLYSSCAVSPSKNILLNDGWKFSEIDTEIWYRAEVPGTVQTDLLRLGKIPDPFLKNNEDSIQWISKKNWQYKKDFSASSEILKKKKHFLNFEGLDTYAEVFLNGTKILSSDNAFRKWEIDVSDILQPENKLLIIFTNIDKVEKEKASKLDYKLPDDGRVFTRKPQYLSGWDWAPIIKTIGIWRNVTLTSYDYLKMEDVFLQTKSIKNNLAEVVAKFEIESIKAENFTIKIHNKTTNQSFSKNFKSIPSQKQYEIPFKIKNPKLWWTHNLGEPFLYDIEVKLIYNGKVIETHSKKLGLRTIKLITEKDSIGESFYFELNGKPVYMKGANYIPQQMMDVKINRKKSSDLIDDVVSANMNMLRVWGGGIYEDDYFYDLCDEKGILVWQDFMFAGGMYPGDKEFLKNVKAEAEYNVKRLRNHACIALWCGNNEISEGWERWGWKDDKTEIQKQEIEQNYKAIFEDILPKTVGSLNPNISYWASSPKYGRGDKRYQFEGDAHDWWVWHDGYPFEHFEEEVPRFMSEFGFQSFPNVETIKYATGRDSVIMNDPLFENHQKHKRGFQIIDEYMSRDFQVPKDAADYVYVSQLLQAYGISKGIHAQRRAKPYNMGTLYWQLNDCWPVVSWSSIDYLGNWKALHYQVKNSFQNVLISAKIASSKNQKENETLDIFVINDTFKTINDSLSLVLLDFNGYEIFQEKIIVQSLPNSSKILFNLPLNNLKIDKAFSVLKINFGATEYLHYFAKPKDLKLLKDDIKIKVENELINKNEKNIFKITLSSKTLQKNVFLGAETQGKFSDNYFDLLPNTSKTIYFYTDGKTAPKLEYKTLNLLIN